MNQRSYLAAAFNARPLGMLIPPNWLGLATVGLLGAFLNPGFWLVGAGLELGYLYWLSRSSRFRATVDATGGGPLDWNQRRQELLSGLDAGDRRRQEELEGRCVEIAATLRGRIGTEGQVEGLTRLAWLHLRLLGARSGLGRVSRISAEEAHALEAQAASLRDRLSKPDLDGDLRRTLEQQAAVVEARRRAHVEAGHRLERVDAEIERIRQQVALVQEQTLLSTDDAQVASSVDSLSASLNEASRWMQQEPEIFGSLDLDAPPPPLPALRNTGNRARRATSEES
jgi:hypothetical protein